MLNFETKIYFHIFMQFQQISTDIFKPSPIIIFKISVRKYFGIKNSIECDFLQNNCFTSNASAPKFRDFYSNFKLISFHNYCSLYPHTIVKFSFLTIFPIFKTEITLLNYVIVLRFSNTLFAIHGDIFNQIVKSFRKRKEKSELVIII